MGMTVGIKSSGDRHLDLHFSSSNYDGNGKWGTLHIEITNMQLVGEGDYGQTYRNEVVRCELDHDDIDRLIRELQAAKALLAGDEPTAVHHHPGLPSMISLSDWEAKRMRELFEPLPQPEPDLMTLFKPEAICLQCGHRADRHSYSGACIEHLPNQMIRFSKTERFRA